MIGRKSQRYHKVTGLCRSSGKRCQMLPWQAISWYRKMHTDFDLDYCDLGCALEIRGFFDFDKVVPVARIFSGRGGKYRRMPK